MYKDTMSLCRLSHRLHTASNGYGIKVTEQQFSGTRERHSSQGQDMWCSSEQADSVDVNETWSRAQRDITPIPGANITGSYLRSQSVFKTWGETTIIIFHPSTDMSNRVLHRKKHNQHTWTIAATTEFLALFIKSRNVGSQKKIY